MLVSQKIESILAGDINSGKYADGEKLPSIRVLSKEYSASYVMIARAIEKLKERELVKTFPGRGTFAVSPKAPLIRPGVRTVYFVFADPMTNPREEYQLEVYSHVQMALREAGFIDRALQFDENAIDNHDDIAGFIVTHHSPLLPLLRKQKIPAVYCSSEPADIQFSSVSPDFYSGSYAVTRHLIEAGHRRIGFVTVADQSNQSSFAARAAGFTDAINDAGLPFYEPIPWHFQNSPERLMTILQNSDRPSALFVANDHMAEEIMRMLASTGLGVPEDLSIAGLENMNSSQYTTPQLTTAGYDRKQLAQTTVQLLTDLINGKEHGIINKKIPMRLIIRNSVKRVN